MANNSHQLIEAKILQPYQNLFEHKSMVDNDFCIPVCGDMNWNMWPPEKDDEHKMVYNGMLINLMVNRNIHNDEE
jgi:hypothetical protein